MRVWPSLTWNFSVTLRNSLLLSWPLWLHNEPWQTVVFLEDVGRSKWGKVHINDFVSVLRKAHWESAGEIHVGKVTQWQSQYWNPLLPGSQSTVPTTHSKLARALCPGDPRVAVAYTPFHLVPSPLLEGSFIVDFSIFRKDFFFINSFSEWKNRFGQLPDRIFWHHWIQPNSRSEVSPEESVSQRDPVHHAPSSWGAGGIPKV